MNERIFRVRNPGGVELEPASPEDVCELISQGEIDLEATASELGDAHFYPITQFPKFAKAFEARFGISSRTPGSDSTPRAGRGSNSGLTPSGATPSVGTSGSVPVEDHTLRFIPSVPLLELASRPAELKDSQTFKPQDLDAWTPLSMPATAPLPEVPPPRPTAAVPEGIADDLSPPSLRALPPESPEPTEPVPLETRIQPRRRRMREDDEPLTPVTRTSPALEAMEVTEMNEAVPDPSLEELSGAEAEPRTPLTHAGISTDVDLPAQVIVGDPVDDGRTRITDDLIADGLITEFQHAAVEPTPVAPPVAPPVLQTPQRRMISELVRPSPASISVPQELVSAVSLDVDRPRAPDALGYALAAWAVLFLIFYGAGIALELGNEEARWIPTGYYWARILLLISAGIGLSTMFLKDDVVGTARFMVSPKWTAVGVLVGIVAGLVSPGQKLGAGLPVALSMGFLQVVSEEIFFRGYVDRALVRSVPGIAVPTVIAAVMYGCFQLTYGTLWLDRSLPEVLLHAGAAIVLVGVPLSFLHHRTRGFVAPFVCHVVVMMVMLLGAS